VSLESLRGYFDSSVNPAAQQRLIRMLFHVYRKADDFCEELLDGPETHDTLPILRRALAEQSLRFEMAKVDGAIATAEPNKVGNSFHTRVMIGRIVLTESAVESPDALVRPAEFRNAYAVMYQLAMSFVDQETPPADGLIYTVLLHGLEPGKRGLPGFVHVAFPNPTWTRYVDRIDLLRRYPEMTQELRGEMPEPVTIPAASLRRDVRINAPEDAGA
jgi:hypothetical protein